MNEHDTQIFRELLRSFDREIDRVNSGNSCYGVTVAQCHVLLEIEKQKATNVKELAIGMKLDKSTVSRTVEGLVSLGLINRDIPKENRRKTLIKLTSQGRKTCALINKRNNSYFQQVFATLKKDEVGVFLMHFKQLTKSMTELNDIPE